MNAQDMPKRAMTPASWFVVAGLALVLVVIFADVIPGAYLFPGLRPEPVTSTSGASSRTIAACEHWYNVSADKTDGILTDGEYRGKLLEVRRGSADDPELHAAITELAADYTSEPPLVARPPTRIALAAVRARCAAVLGR